MPLPWRNVIEKDEYKTLSGADQAKAKLQYFDEIVAPQISENKIEQVRSEFLQDAARMEINRDKPSFIRDVIGKTILKFPQRTAGLAIGAINSPLAFVWGSQQARFLDKEQFDKMPIWTQALISIGAGIDSMKKSTFKEGEWGTLYGDYYKSVKGKTIREDLPDNLKWAAPTIEFIANMISDPLILTGSIKNLARFKIPKGWMGKIPDKIVKDLQMIEKAEQAEKQVLQGKLLEALQNRKGYMQWWEDQPLTPFEKIIDYIDRSKRGKPIYKARMPEPLEKTWTAIDTEAKEKGLIAETPLKTKQEIAKEKEAAHLEAERRTRQSLEKSGDKNIGEPLIRREPEVLQTRLPTTLRDFGIKVGREKEIVRKAPIPEKVISKPGLSREVAAPTEIGTKAGAIEALTDAKITDSYNTLRKEAGTSFVNIADLRDSAGVDQVVIDKFVKRQAKEGKAHTSVGDWSFADEHMRSGAVEVGNRKALMVKMLSPEEVEKYAPILSKEKPPRNLPLKLRVVAGSSYGIEEDENGNISFNPRKALVGTIAAIGGVKIVDAVKNKAALQTLSKYPAWAKVASGIGKEKQVWSVPELIAKMNVKLFDRFATLKKISPKTYEQTRRFSAYKDQALLNFRPLVKAFDKIRKDNFIMSSYIKAHRDLTRAERGIKNPGGATLTDAKQAIKDIETEWISKDKKLEDLQSTLDAFNQWTHDEILYPVYESGFISKEAYEDIIKNNKWYATYDVIEHMPENLDNIPNLGSKEYFSNANQSIIKAMKGTEKQILDPLESTIKKFTSAQYAIARNKVANTLIDDPVMQSLIRPIATNKAEYGIMKNQGFKPFMQGGVDKRKWGTINRFKNGRVERYAVPKPIADSMKQLTPRQTPRVIMAYNAIFRATATTLSPAFLVRNVFRDALLGYISSPYHGVLGQPRFVADWGKGVWEATKKELGKSSLVDDYIKSGGSFGWAGSEAFEEGGKQVAKNMLFEKSAFRKGVSIVTTPFKLMTTANEIIEMAPRLGIFERGMKLGYTLEDAAMRGRQATIDFNRGGTFLKVANQYIPFLNARVQAKVTLVEALKKDPKGTSAKIFTMIILPGVSAYAYNRLYHPDLYDDIPSYIRKDNFCLIYGKQIDEKTGKTSPKYIAIPKGDVGTLFNPIEFALDNQYKKNPQSIKEFSINFLSDLSPVEFAEEGKLSLSKTLGSVTPPILKAPLEDWANLRFYQGTNIVPYWMGKTMPPELQYRDSTPVLYKWLGKKTKIAPLRLQNYGADLFTSYGRTGFSPKAMMDTMTGAILKDTGGQIEREVFKVIKNMETGYITARANADKLVEEGDRAGANAIMNQWNSGLNKAIAKYNERFADKGLQDQGGLRKSYLFTMEKRRNILLKQQNNLTPLEKRLRR